MLRAVIALLFGEGLVLAGLWWAYPPLCLVVAGSQVVAVALFRGGRA